jgi:hypothetical protein
MEAKEVSTQANPMITLSYHPIGADETLRKEKLLLRSPSVSVAVPILEKVSGLIHTPGGGGDSLDEALQYNPNDFLLL